MKIIKRGRVPDQKCYRNTCRACGSVIEYTRIEARYVPDQRDGDYLEIACPVCQETMTQAL